MQVRSSKYRGVGKNRTPVTGTEMPRQRKTDTVTATIHAELASCKIEIPNPLTTICEKYETSVPRYSGHSLPT
jgi:hypothetical protein